MKGEFVLQASLRCSAAADCERVTAYHFENMTDVESLCLCRQWCLRLALCCALTWHQQGPCASALRPARCEPPRPLPRLSPCMQTRMRCTMMGWSWRRKSGLSHGQSRMYRGLKIRCMSQIGPILISASPILQATPFFHIKITTTHCYLCTSSTLPSNMDLPYTVSRSPGAQSLAPSTPQARMFVLSLRKLTLIHVAPCQEVEEEGNASEDRLGGERERVPLSALFGGSGQHTPDQAPGDNEASRHSFTGLSWRRASPDQAHSSRENRAPEPSDQNGCLHRLLVCYSSFSLFRFVGWYCCLPTLQKLHNATTVGRMQVRRFLATKSCASYEAQCGNPCF